MILTEEVKAGWGQTILSAPLDPLPFSLTQHLYYPTRLTEAAARPCIQLCVRHFMLWIRSAVTSERVLLCEVATRSLLESLSVTMLSSTSRISLQNRRPTESPLKTLGSVLKSHNVQTKRPVDRKNTPVKLRWSENETFAYALISHQPLEHMQQFDLTTCACKCAQNRQIAPTNTKGGLT